MKNNDYYDGCGDYCRSRHWQSWDGGNVTIFTSANSKGGLPAAFVQFTRLLIFL